MTDQEKTKKFEQLSQDKEFLESMAKADTREDIRRVFFSYGMELTHEEVDAFIDLALQDNQELNENMLDEVAGGVSAAALLKAMADAAWNVGKYCWSLGKKFANWEDSLTKKK